MKMLDAKFEKNEPQNAFGIQLDSPMPQISPPGVCEMKPFLGEDARGYSTQPEG